MAALWGLLGAGFIGCADGVTKINAARMSLVVLVFLASWFAFFGMLATLGLPDLSQPAHYFPLAYSAVAGILHLAVLFLLFPALLRGPVSLAATGVSSGVIFVFAFNAIAGEPWTYIQLGAGVAVFLGIAMASRGERRTLGSYSTAHLRITAALGVSAGLISATRIFLIQESAATVGPVDSLLAMRFGACVTVLPVLIVVSLMRRETRWPRVREYPLVIAQAAFEVLAFLALLVGSVEAGRIGASLGYAAAPVASTLIARIFLGEAIGRRRGFWIVFVAAAIACAALGAPK